MDCFQEAVDPLFFLGLRALLLQGRTANSSGVSGRSRATLLPVRAFGEHSVGDASLPFCRLLLPSNGQRVVNRCAGDHGLWGLVPRGCPWARRPVRHQANFSSRQGHGYPALHWEQSLPQLFLQL